MKIENIEKSIVILELRGKEAERILQVANSKQGNVVSIPTMRGEGIFISHRVE